MNKCFLDLVSEMALVESKARAMTRLIRGTRFASLFCEATTEEQEKLIKYVKELEIDEVRHVLNGIPTRLLRSQAAALHIHNYSRKTKDELIRAIKHAEAEIDALRNAGAPCSETIPNRSDSQDRDNS